MEKWSIDILQITDLIPKLYAFMFFIGVISLITSKIVHVLAKAMEGMKNFRFLKIIRRYLNLAKK